MMSSIKEKSILVLNKYNIFDYWLEVVVTDYHLKIDSKLISNARIWLPTILSKNYSAIIFLAGEMRLLNISLIKHYSFAQWSRYFTRLESLGIIEVVKKNKEILNQYKYLSGVGDWHLKNLIFYKLTDQAKSFFFEPLVLEIMKSYIDFDSLNKIIQGRKEDYEKNFKHREEKKKRDFNEEMRKAELIPSSAISHHNNRAKDSEKSVITELKQYYKDRDLVKTRLHIIAKGWEEQFPNILICINKILEVKE